MGVGDHDCEWRDRAEKLAAELADERAGRAALSEEVSRLAAIVEKLQRHAFGKRSEKIPPVGDELRRAGVPSDPAAALEKRRANAEKKRTVVTREIHHKVPDDQKTCPKCGGHDFTPLGNGKITELYDLLPAIIERQLHVQEKLRCRCGETILTAPGAARVFDKARYGPSFIAHVVVSKIADAIPLHRLAKQFQRSGVPLHRSTLVDLFDQCARSVEPLYVRLLELVPTIEIVHGDETTMRVLAKGKTRTSWLWTFLGNEKASACAEKPIIAYVYSNSRSGETPARVLGNSTGMLVADKYSGYNKVTTPGGRVRVGCLAHVRRKFFDALSSAPEAQRAMDFIIKVYKVERAAHGAGIAGSPQHLEMRQARSRQVIDDFKAWLEAEQPRHLPKEPMGEAIGYALGQWDALTRFLADARIPVDNNPSERALRAAALGRKNWLFVGHDESGENVAGLFSLVATCEANGVNPTQYLADVLLRVQTHPATRIDELLPQNWKPPTPKPPT
jgi:transposase